VCGICGIHQVEPRPIDVAVLSDMTTSLAHRGPDDAACHFDDHAGLGFRRLSIIDLAGGRQPMTDGRGLWSMCNGEIYNFPELRAKLEGKGHSFRGHSDTEVLLALPENEYAAESVNDGGPEWTERFRRIVRATPPRVLGDSQELPSWVAGRTNYSIWNRNNLWTLHAALAHIHADVTLIALFDGKKGDGPGGPFDMIQRARARHERDSDRSREAGRPLTGK